MQDVQTIAADLGITPRAVQYRAKRLGVGRFHTNRLSFTRKEALAIRRAGRQPRDQTQSA